MLSASVRALMGVSRETEERLSIYVESLLKWNKKINLIGKATEADIWNRHIADSAQLDRLAENAKTWVDLGSGAGLPALIVAAMRADQHPEFTMTIVESDQRKCAFVADAARRMGTPINIVNKRIEKLEFGNFDVVSARALAPLTTLLKFATPLKTSDTICLFPKGMKVDQELTEAAKDWHMTYEKIPSVTDDASVILKIRAFESVA